MSSYHVPVLLAEVLNFLLPVPGKVIIDATLGGGGHSLAMLEKMQGQGLLIGVDQDQEAIAEANSQIRNKYANFLAVSGNFDDLELLVSQAGVTQVDGILMDLGVSSHQLDEPERGFSFRNYAPLDMRMNASGSGITAADIVAEYSEEELTDIIRTFGEDKFARRIARAIVNEREVAPILTTSRLAAIISDSVPPQYPKRGAQWGRHKPIHPATRTFQALRIAVNDEMGVLSGGLEAAVRLLKSGGRLAVISYHSLEDRIVKNTFRKYAGVCTCPPRVPVCCCNPVKVLKTLTSHPILPSDDESMQNPRARSAKMRVAEKF